MPEALAVARSEQRGVAGVVCTAFLMGAALLSVWANGHDATPAAEIAATSGGGTSTDSTFETQVAPLLARRCLECHDAATRQDRLDLSQKDSAFRGGDSGNRRTVLMGLGTVTTGLPML